MKIDVRIETLTKFEEWKRPTVKEVSLFIGAESYTKLSADNFEKVFKWKSRTVRRWKDKCNMYPSSKSTIPYSCWALILLYVGIDIIGYDNPHTQISNEDLVLLDSYLANESYQSPPYVFLMKFVGESSYSRLHRDAICKLLGWKKDQLEYNILGNISYADLLALLKLCNYPILKVLSH